MTPTVVCLASFFKGGEFIRECKRHGWRTILIVKNKLRHEAWPHESLDALLHVPDDADADLFIHTVSELARRQRLDRIVALEEYDVFTAALVREHLRIPGMGTTTARVFRDKLAMRVKALEAGIQVPDFLHVLNHDDLRAFMDRVPPPWVLKPRSDVSAIGIQKLSSAEQVWRAIDVLDARASLRERSSFYLLERYVPGDVYHVDSLVEDRQVVFAGANRYARPPLDVAHHGGVFVTYTLEDGSADQRALLEMNRKVLDALGLVRGAAHAEFIKSAADGRFYFLEVAARVGGAFIAEVLDAASGINIWHEWAKLELTRGERPYAVPAVRKDYAGIALSLARQEHPDTSAYTDPEIVYRVNKRHHVGLVVRSPRHARVVELLDQYVRRVTEEFCAIEPPLERPE